MIVHVLKNGKTVKSIKGHKVSRKDVPKYYDLADRVTKTKMEKQ